LCAGARAAGENGAAANTRIVNPKAREGFGTIQAAINSVPDGNAAPVVIEITPGRYEEHITIPATKRFITLRGMADDPADVWIGGTIVGQGAILTSRGADFRCEHLTLEDLSSAPPDVAHSAIYLSAPRQVIEDCLLLGTHNTVAIWTETQAYFHSCRITGTSDIVFGPATAIFDNCDILVTSVGSIATPNTPKNIEFGLIFLDCRLTGQGSNSPTLMRPWSADAHAAFIRCSIDGHFRRTPWTPWAGRETTCRAEESGSVAPDNKTLLDLSNRPAWVHRLSAEEARRYTVSKVFRWDPHTNGR
jgi:pectinesterase